MQNKDSIQNILMIGIGLCLVCAAVISIIAVGLKELQKNNAILDQQKKIVAAADLQGFYGSTEAAFDSIEEIIIDIEEGLITNDSTEKYDLSKELRDPSRHIVLSSIEDIATIKKRENFSKIFLEYREDQLNTVILPVRGYGLWGILYGYLAISSDLNTIVGLEFYEHKETPGLGAEVDNPKWKAQWKGKKIYKDKKVNLAVIKGKVEAGDSELSYKIDGLSGATITSRGVTNMVAYWFGESGYSSLLRELNYES